MISKSTIRRFIVMFTVCFIVLIGTQLMDVSASDDKTTQEEITHLPQVLNENEQVNLVTSEVVDDGATEETSAVVEGEGTKEAPEVVDDGATEETSAVVEGEGTKEAPEVVDDGATEETSEVVEGEGTKEAPEVVDDEGTKETSAVVEGEGTKEAPEVVDDGATEETSAVVEGEGTKEAPEMVEDEGTKEAPEVVYVPEQQYKVENIQLLASKPDELPFPVVIRDFKADYEIFEGVINYAIVPDLVEKTLSTTKKPLFTSEGIHTLVTNAGYTRSNQALIDAYAFYEANKDTPYSKITFNKDEQPYHYYVYHLNKLFLNVDGLNESIKRDLILDKNDSEIYEFIDTDFFPIDNQLLGNQDRVHNYHFTLESHTQFWFSGEEPLTFTFKGDDDVWVYIDNKQVIDLGGVHEVEQQSFIIVPEKLQDGKVIGHVKNSDGNPITVDGTPIIINAQSWYDFDFFFMERHTTESNLMITTNMEFNPKVEIEKIPYMIDSSNKEKIIKETDVVYPGETVYYKFIVKNSGNVNLTNTVINDPLLKLNISSSGITRNGQSVTNSEILVNGKKGNLSILDNLVATPSTSVEIKSRDFYYVVTDSDVSKGKITNTATVSAKHQGEEFLQEARATVNVTVNEINPNIIKLNAIVDKSIKTVNGKDYKANMLLNPGDKVIFSVKVTNNSTSENPLTGKVNIAIDKLDLSDVLTMGQNREDNFVFKLNNTPFDVSDFSLAPNQSIELMTGEWEVPVPSVAVESNYRGNNKVVLKRKGTQLGESTVSFDIARPKIKIKKEVIGKVDKNQTFDILVTGSDGSTHPLSLTKDQTKVVENLYYGVEYTISEINIPANYQLHSISTNSVEMSTESNNQLITVTNIERPSLSIQKVIKDGVASNESFVINIKGSDESQYNVRVEANQTVILNNLSYGVNYTISEDRVPMNYELVGINGTKNKSINIEFNENKRNDNVIVTNKLVNNKWFFDRQKIENLFKISK